MRMRVCSHTCAHTPTPHTYLKLRENAESPHASSCLPSSPLVREGEQTWQQPVLGAQEEAGPSPWLQASSTVWGSGHWGPRSVVPAAGPPSSTWGWKSDSGFALTLAGRCCPGFSPSSGLWTLSICRNSDYFANRTLCQEDTWFLLFILWDS